MVGLDPLLAKPLESIIRSNLGNQALRKIEKRLFERYGIGLTQSIEDFHKLDSVLREFFGAGADSLEKKFLESVIAVEKTKNKSHEWVTIHDPALSRVILESFGDKEKNKILNALFKESRLISEVLDVCKISQTSGYRKINSLIKDGLVVPHGYVITRDGKKVNRYASIFDNVKINIEKNRIVINVQLSKESLKNTTVLQVTRGF